MGPAQRARLRQFFEEYRKTGQYEVLLRSYPPNPGYFGRTAEFEAASAYIARQSSCVELLSPEELRRYEQACRTADALDRELQARQEESLTVPPDETYFELEIQEVLELGLHAVEWTCGIVSFIPYDDIRDIIERGDSDFQMPHLLLDPGDLVLKAVGHMVGNEIVFTFGETEADRGGTLAQFLTLPPDEIERILQADPSLRCIDNDKAHELRVDWRYHRVVRDGGEWRIRSEDGGVIIWVPDEESAVHERVPDSSSRQAFSDVERRLLVSLIEVASLAGGSPFTVPNRIMRLSAAVLAAHEPMVRESLESLQSAGFIRTLVEDESQTRLLIEPEMVSIPVLDAERRSMCLDARIRRTLLFHAYEEFRISRGARVTALVELAEDLGVPQELISTNVEVLRHESLLDLPFADGGTCQAQIEVEGIRLCEDPSELFAEFCCYSLPDNVCAPTPAAAREPESEPAAAGSLPSLLDRDGSAARNGPQFCSLDHDGSRRITRDEYAARRVADFDLCVDQVRRKAWVGGGGRRVEIDLTAGECVAISMLMKEGIPTTASKALRSTGTNSEKAAKRIVQSALKKLTDAAPGMKGLFVCHRGTADSPTRYEFSPPDDLRFCLLSVEADSESRDQL